MVIKSDVDQIENQQESDRNSLSELETRIANLERQISQSGIGQNASTEAGNALVPATSVRRRGSKRAYLVGADPHNSSVQWLVKVHDYRGKSIYSYDLITGKGSQLADSGTSVIDDEISRYEQIGHEITHPGTIPLSNISAWIDHAKREAARLGLTIEKQPSSPIRWFIGRNRIA